MGSWNSDLILHEPSGVTLYKKTLMPETVAFNEVFSQAYKGGAAKTTNADAGGGQTIAIGGSCSYHKNSGGAYSFFHVIPTELAILKIAARMLPIKNDTLHFQIVDHCEGWSLVVVNYNTIIGSAYVAYIKTETIPQELI